MSEVQEQPKDDAQAQRRCRYCRNMTKASLIGDSEGWTDTELQRGHRPKNGGREYHCYPAYVEG